MGKNCYCGSLITFELCCQKFIDFSQNAKSAEDLMRSRYSAYATQAIDYLMATTALFQRQSLSKRDILIWSQSNQWDKLEIIDSTSTTVEFKAYYTDSKNVSYIHYEKSIFIIEDEKWCYVDGEFY
jgi:SEC-C motif-containing protein